MFKYCPNCRTKLVHKVERLIDCKKCGFHFYLSPALTNGAIIENSKGEILLVRRKIDPKKGFWDTPGGFVEYGETFEESLIREVKEELGIIISNLKYLSSQTDRYFYNGINYHTICAFFKGNIDENKIVTDDDVDGFQFFPKNKIPYDKIAFEGVKKAIYSISAFSSSDAIA